MTRQLPPPRLSSAEIKRRVKLLAETAKAQGMNVGAIRLSATGDISVVDASAVPVNPEGQDLSDFV